MTIKMSKAQYRALTGKEGGNTPVGKQKASNKARNKYHNKHVSFGGLTYDSVAERDRHLLLLKMEARGEIKNLRFHDKNDIIVLQDEPLITYEPDFCYTQEGVSIIEDVKGAQTKEFVLKKKMLIKKLHTGEIKGEFILTKKKNRNSFEVMEKYSS